MRLKDKVCLITGASRGIGRAVAEGFAQAGAKLFLVGHVDQKALDETLNHVRELGADAEGGLFDVADYDDVKRLADVIEKRYGTLDVLVNNAGIIKPTPLLEITPAQWEQTVRTHLHGSFYCLLEMVNRFMKGKGAGKIINVTTIAALRASYGVADYAAAKGGIIAFTRSAALELLPFNIQVNAILPIAGTRMTNMLAEYRRRAVGEEAGKRLKNLPSPQQVAPAFLFLASRDSDYVTGQVLTADGGFTI